jgi:hypothetical protein
VKTLNLYKVSYKSTVREKEYSFNVAAATKKEARQQTKDYSKTITGVTSVERLGNVNVPVNLPPGL